MRSKAETIHWLASRVTASRVPESFSFSVADWEQNPSRVQDEIMMRFGEGRVAIRSSAFGEDGAATSAAGAYVSVLGVDASSSKEVQKSVSSVLESYRRNGRTAHIADEVLVQAMVNGSLMSGVVFTHDLASGAPYLVVNYDDASGRTDTVTSGNTQNSNKTLYVHRGRRSEVRSRRFRVLLDAVEEVEALLRSEFLDIEFALGEDLVPELLQVREITTQVNWNRSTARSIDTTLDGVQRFVEARLKPMPGVLGSTTVFGQMPDWNPAEMIGRAPRALSLSLYTGLITDDAWRVARERMGYAVPNGQKLLVSLAGQPFIDSRLSFHSFLPATINSGVGQRLVDAWVEKLADRPELHDKIEFEVAVSSYRFDLPDRISALCGNSLTRKEQVDFIGVVRAHTRSLILDCGSGSVAEAESAIDELRRRQDTHQEMIEAGSEHALLAMISDVVQFGTVPFAVLARHAFVAKSLLDSLVTVGAISGDRLSEWYAGVQTVAGELVSAIHALEAQKLSRAEFLERYGFLRPGTYDILSLRYDQMPVFAEPRDEGRAVRHRASATQLPLSTESPAVVPRLQEKDFAASEREAIGATLGRHGFGDIDVDLLFTYARRAIAGRERAKFVFTRTVSEILETIADFGNRNHLSREELSHLAVTDVLEMLVSSQRHHIEDELRVRSIQNGERHMVTAAVRLPQILHDTAGVHIVPFQTAVPNFITSRRVAAPLVRLSDGVHNTDGSLLNLSGKVVLIAGADPGYDWIFAYPIAGLVTKFGGANSHMAIRCAEFGLPAAIGCGEQIYEALSGASAVSLDCSARIVQPWDAG